MGNGKEFVFSSSKMGGLPEHNKDGFDKKRRELKEKYDWLVYDQFNHFCMGCWSKEIGMDIEVLEDKCWAIYMWGKWYKAQGCWVELVAAHRLGLIIYIEQRWLRWIEWGLDLLCDYKKEWE